MTALGWFPLFFAVSPRTAQALGGAAIAETSSFAVHGSKAAHATMQRSGFKPTQIKTSRNALPKKRRTPSRFVLLGQRILNDSLLCRDEFEQTGTAVLPAVNGCLTNDQKLLWAFGTRKDTPVGFTSHPFVDLELSDRQQVIIQPLHLHLGEFSPLFKQYFTPSGKGNYLSMGNQTLAEDAWLREQILLSSSDNSILGQEFPDPGPESAGPPFAYSYRVARDTAVLAGVGWIDDVADTTGMSQAFALAGLEEQVDTVGAVNVIFGARFSNFSVTGGYIRAIEAREHSNDFMALDQETEPTAWSSELAYATRFMGWPTTLAIGYQKSSEALSHVLPEERYTTKASIFLHNSARLSLEYYQDREYSTDNALDEDEDYGITTKLGFQF
jgi:hypothetical protein